MRPKKSGGQQQVRIVGGQWRRRILRFPDAEGLRPTPDRVRETLFNWLGQNLLGQTCLDLFAGSGALGFEAASRGASKVVMVERSPKAFKALLENAQQFKPETVVELISMDALEFARSCQNRQEGFDILFADPPYRQGWIERLTPFLPFLLKESGSLYLEAETPVLTLGNWKTIRSGRAGQVCFHLLKQG